VPPIRCRTAQSSSRGPHLSPPRDAASGPRSPIGSSVERDELEIPILDLGRGDHPIDLRAIYLGHADVVLPHKRPGGEPPGSGILKVLSDLGFSRTVERLQQSLCTFYAKVFRERVRNSTCHVPDHRNWFVALPGFESYLS